MRTVIHEYKVIDHFQAGTATVLGLDKPIDFLAGDYIIIEGQKYPCVRNSIDSWIVIPNLTLDHVPQEVMIVNE